jgi:hypothetical protein
MHWTGIWPSHTCSMYFMCLIYFHIFLVKYITCRLSFKIGVERLNKYIIIRELFLAVKLWILNIYNNRQQSFLNPLTVAGLIWQFCTRDKCCVTAFMKYFYRNHSHANIEQIMRTICLFYYMHVWSEEPLVSFRLPCHIRLKCNMCKGTHLDTSGRK